MFGGMFRYCVVSICLQATLADSFLADLEDLSDDENHDEVRLWMLQQPQQTQHFDL